MAVPSQYSGSYKDWSHIVKKISEVFDETYLPVMHGVDSESVRKPLIQALLNAGAIYRNKLEYGN